MEIGVGGSQLEVFGVKKKRIKVSTESWEIPEREFTLNRRKFSLLQKMKYFIILSQDQMHASYSAQHLD